MLGNSVQLSSLRYSRDNTRGLHPILATPDPRVCYEIAGGAKLVEGETCSTACLLDLGGLFEGFEDIIRVSSF